LLDIKELFEPEDQNQQKDLFIKTVINAVYWSIAPWGDGISYDFKTLKNKLGAAEKLDPERYAEIISPKMAEGFRLPGELTPVVPSVEVESEPVVAQRLSVSEALAKMEKSRREEPVQPQPQPAPEELAVSTFLANQQQQKLADRVKPPEKAKVAVAPAPTAANEEK
jgi:hypothetical protein